MTYIYIHTYMINTQLAGASGGALVAASTAVGISPEEQMVAYKDMSRVCRANGGFWGKVGGLVRQSLDEHFPENAHEICNERYGLGVQKKMPSDSEDTYIFNYLLIIVTPLILTG